MTKTSELIWQDAQHQVLFDLIDQIETSEIDSSIFYKLNEYAENHFKLEEEYMARLDYPDMEAHVRAHNQFRKELQSLIVKQHQFDADFKKSLSVFLYEWLRLHILGIDKKLEAFILESSAK